MKKFLITKISLNFMAVVLLLSLAAVPLYFAANFAKVAGVKSSAPYLIVSQIEKFPGLKLTQQQEKYQIDFQKLGPSQAFLGVLVLNNPTESAKTYSIQVSSGSAKLFFGQDLENQSSTITLPSSASVPISLFSGSEATGSPQSIEFKIESN